MNNVYMHIYTCVGYSHTESVQVGFSFGLLMITFFPSTGILFRVGFVVAERLDEYKPSTVVILSVYCRVLYLPSLGFCLLVSIGCKRLHSVLPKVNNAYL